MTEQAVIRLPDGREALVIMQHPNAHFGQRVAQAGRLHWLLEDKCMLEAFSFTIPEWPRGVYAWRITQRATCPITLPGHDAAILAFGHEWGASIDWYPNRVHPWQALL